MKRYFKILLVLYILSLLLCVSFRVVLKLYYMDNVTGFYNGGDVFVTVLNAALITTVAVMFLSNRFKRPDGGFPVSGRNAGVNIMALLAGAAVLAFTLSGAPEIMLEQGRSPIFGEISRYLNYALGAFSGLSFIYLGVTGVFGRNSAAPGVLLAAPSVWQVILLLTRYNGYTAVLTISDHLMVVMFMLLNAMFLLGHARTILRLMRRDGRNYAIPAGLCASLFGFVLTVPCFADILLYGGADMPLSEIFLHGAPVPSAPLIGMIECAYIFIMSLYELCFVIGLMRSIKEI